MRYSVFHTNNFGVSGYQMADLPNAVRRAIEIIDASSPGSTVYITDHETGREYSEPEIRNMEAELPPASRSMFGNADA